MKVIELIEQLKKCNPDDTVLYDGRNFFSNEEYNVEYHEEYHMGVDDVLIGGGTLRGYVFLEEFINGAE